MHRQGASTAVNGIAMAYPNDLRMLEGALREAGFSRIAFIGDKDVTAVKPGAAMHSP